VRLVRIEALARIVEVRSLDPLRRCFLSALALTPNIAPPALQSTAAAEWHSCELSFLQRVLGLNSGLLLRMLFQEGQEGLVTRSDAHESEAQQRWRLTAAGSHALASGRYAVESSERRVFHFLRMAGPPARYEFLNLASLEYTANLNSQHLGIAVDEEVPALEILAHCIAKPLDWKQKRGFPVEIANVVKPGTAQVDGATAEPTDSFWKKVLVCRSMQGLLLFVREKADLQAFAVKPERWELQASPACLVLNDCDVRSVVPSIADEPTIEAWRAAWLAWGHSHGLPESEMRSAEVSSEGFHLRVRVTKRLADRLRASRSDALTGDAWLLAGEGASRAARVVEITEF
jgi:hypothetical protein